MITPRFAIVVSQFNEQITAGLLKGARAVLAEKGVREDQVKVIHVPGAFEIPLAARKLAETRRFDAVIGLGCLIKGDTMHFEYIASAVAHGIMDAGLAAGVPISFGVLTTLTDEQAEIRSGDGPDNKGREAALAAYEMAVVLDDINPGDGDRT